MKFLFIQQEWLYDSESNIAEVTAYLNELYENLMDCLRRANEYKSYQKQFRVK